MAESGRTSSSLAYFVLDGDVLLPDPVSKGPWGPAISGHVVGGILARALENAGHSDGFQPARVTVDLLRPTVIAPLQVRASVRREGRRIRLIDAEVVQNDVVVARAGAVFLRPGDSHIGDIWSSDIQMPPMPSDPGPLPDDLPMFVWGYGGEGSSGEIGFAEWHTGGPKYMWISQRRVLVAGETISPFVEATMAADATSALTHWGTQGLQYINVDYTLSLTRLPKGPNIGMAAVVHTSHDGIASGTAALFDEYGPIGNSMAVAVVNPVESFRPGSMK
ncbi:thioesterase family protein [Mycobacterium sp. NBC_00419]|uniref:thioesterase family protein n=1 Tax=Mycobacterium sp. NBC_00419 TaxID=2975989 RepID=UPI002E1D28DB